MKHQTAVILEPELFLFACVVARARSDARSKCPAIRDQAIEWLTDPDVRLPVAGDTRQPRLSIRRPGLRDADGRAK